MIQIKVSDFDRIGDRLFLKNKNYLQELVDRDLEIIGGQAQIDPELIPIVFPDMKKPLKIPDGFPIPQ
jgi:hypothetical protein